MFRPASRCLWRQSVRPLHGQHSRYLSTAPPHLKSRSWRNSAMRWTIAAAGVYFYNTSPLFAEEPVSTLRDPPGAEEELPTLQSLSPSSRFQPPHPSDPPSVPPTPKSTSPPSIDPKAPLPSSSEPQSPQELEEDAAQQGAFNEETGEINWDCPCLGGMAHGPCGPEFREAFSCFVFSKEEPKGMDCIEKFKGMQNCFREHPEVYASELEDDDDDLAQDERGMVAGAMPEDSPNVAATEASAKTMISEKVDQARDSAQDITQTASDLAGGISERVASTKDAVSDAVQGVKKNLDTVVPEQGGHNTEKSSDLNAGRRDKASESEKTQPSGSNIEEVQRKVQQTVPKAAKDARGPGGSSSTEK